MGTESPSSYEIKNKYLDIEYKDMDNYVNFQRRNGIPMGAQLCVMDGPAT